MADGRGRRPLRARISVRVSTSQVVAATGCSMDSMPRDTVTAGRCRTATHGAWGVARVARRVGELPALDGGCESASVSDGPACVCPANLFAELSGPRHARSTAAKTSALP
jgi:hypothetical protein